MINSYLKLEVKIHWNGYEMYIVILSVISTHLNISSISELYSLIAFLPRTSFNINYYNDI